MSRSKGGRRRSPHPPPVPGNNVPSCVCNNQPESQTLQQAGGGGREGRAQENRDCRLNQYCNPAVTHRLYEATIGGGGLLSLNLTCGFLADAVNTHGNDTPGRGAEVCVRSEQQTFRQELVSIHKSGSVLVFLQPTAPSSSSPPPATHTHVTATSSHSQRSLLPKNATERVNFPLQKGEKNGLFLMIFDCAVGRVLLVKMLIFPPNRQT